MTLANPLDAAAFVGVCGQRGSAIAGGVSLAAPRDLGILERGAGVVTSLQSLQAKLSNLRDRIEGDGKQSGCSAPGAPMGLSPQLTEAETILRACHALLDDIAGKF